MSDLSEYLKAENLKIMRKVNANVSIYGRSDRYALYVLIFLFVCLMALAAGGLK